VNAGKIRCFIYFEQKMQQKLFAVFSLLLFCGIGYSQNTISGKVLSNSQFPLAGSHIHIGQKSVSADASGFYVVSDLPSGKTKIYISYIGYQSIDTLVDIRESAVINFNLKQNMAKLDEVTVQQKANSHNHSVLEQKLKTETIEKYSNQTLGDALKEISGVSSLKTGSTVVKPVINGLYGSRVPVINNNVRMEDQQWGIEHAPNLDINSAGKITVIKGASGLQYGGDAVGGLVIVEPITVKKDTLFGKTIMNLSSNGRGGTISTSLHKGNFCDWSWNVQGSFKYLGDRETPDYVLSNTGNREANFSGDLKYMGKKYDVTAFYSFYNAQIGILSASHVGSANDLFYSINRQVPAIVNDFTYNLINPKQEVKHHLAKVNYNYYLSESATVAVQYAFQFDKRLEYDLRRGEYNSLAALDLELTTHAVNIDYKKDFGNWNLKTGISGGHQENFTDPTTKTRALIPSYNKVDAAFYGIVNFDVSDKLSLDGGLRYDFSDMHATKFYQKSRWTERGYDAEFSDIIVGESGTQWLTKPNFTFHNLSASLGLHQRFSDGLDWFANASLATRNPNPSEFFSDGLHHSTGMIEIGDLSLQQEQSFKLSTTLKKNWESFSVEFNPYLNRINNYMFLKPSTPEATTRGVFPVWDYVQTDAQLAGLDVSTNWKVSDHWKHDFSVSFVYGQDLDADSPLIDMPPLNIGNKIQYSRKEWQGLSLELKSEVVFRQNRFTDNNPTINIVENGAFVPVILDISTPPPAYHLLHFYSEMTFKTFANASAVVAFSVQNILDTTYRDYLNRQRFFADEMGRNFQIQLKINY